MKDACLECGKEYVTYPSRRSKYCSWACRDVPRADPLLKFQKGFQTAGQDECWPWLKATQPGGYGVVSRHRNFGGQIRAHRLAWEIANGRTVPDGMFVCHRCDNPPCVNPAHLFIAPPAGNTADMVAKGRANHAAKGSPGEANHSARITSEIARQIRDSTERTSLLAAAFGISPSTVKRIRNKRLWRHIP